MVQNKNRILENTWLTAFVEVQVVAAVDFNAAYLN